jgi:hypothetical protein
MRRAVLAIVLIAGGALASSRYARGGVMVIVLGTLAPALILSGARALVGGPRAAAFLTVRC